MKSTTMLILSLFIIQLNANRLLQQLKPETTCSGCYNPVTGECGSPVPCPNRDYCGDSVTCKAFPDATCQFTACNECREYFTDSLGIIVSKNVADCDLDICSLPSVTGPCRAAFTRYFHNTQTGKCEEFTYGGCDGNGNNFETLEQCQSQCICSLPSETGLCRAAFTKYFYNSVTGECETFTWGGCGGNSNKFDTKDDCIAECGSNDICTLPADVGPCDGIFGRYFWNSKTAKCDKFTYGGCGGNKNNFERLEDCQSQCKPPVAGDSCGVQGVDCPAIKAAAFTCPDGITCWFNCGKCTWEDDGNGGLFCSNTIPRDRVCPFCGGFENCAKYNDGCNDCGCNDIDNTESCTEKACLPGTETEPLCIQCKPGYRWNAAINACDGCVCPAIFDPVCCNEGQFSNGCSAICQQATGCQPGPCIIEPTECTDLQCRNDRGDCQTKTCILDPCNNNNGGCGKDEICTATTCTDPVCTPICTKQNTVGCGIDHCNSYNDGCNDCICNEDGTESCTEKACIETVVFVPKCTGCEFGYRLNENDKCIAKISCNNNKECDGNKGNRCKIDPICRGQRKTNPLCTPPSPRVCVNKEQQCTSNADCDELAGFTCIGINNQGVGVCTKYQ